MKIFHHYYHGQDWEDPLEKGKATHSSTVAWKIPWAVESMGSHTVGHDWVTFGFTFILDKSRILKMNSIWTGWSGKVSYLNSKVGEGKIKLFKGIRGRAIEFSSYLTRFGAIFCLLLHKSFFILASGIPYTPGLLNILVTTYWTI